MKNHYARTPILCFIVLGILLALYYVPPISVAGWTARRVSMLSDLFPRQRAHVPTYARTTTKAAQAAKDSTQHQPIDYEQFATEEGRDIADFGGEMQGFYSKLQAGHAQIAYFGDSFIEGDILTGDLRRLLQSEFGGSGVGWVDCSSVTENFRSTVRVHSTGFHTHSIADRGYARSHGFINLHYSTPSEGRNQSDMRMVGGNVSRATLWFTTSDTITVLTSVNGGEETPHLIPGGGGLQHISLAGDISRVTWTLETDTIMPDCHFYGATLDGREGIVLDNYSIRGHDGGGIASIPAGRLAAFSDRHYDLIVMGFGLNSANEQEAADGYSRIRGLMNKNISHLRSCYPGTPILIVSVSDRAAKDEYGDIHTMPCIQAMVNAQYEIAKANGCAFYNLYQDMGGYGSIAQMAEKGMANKDYTHISGAGGKMLARKFYEAIKKHL